MTPFTEVSFADLQSHLWESVNILPGPLEAADFKTFIFPLLLFKPTRDNWDDEYQQTGDATSGDQPVWLPASHRLQIIERSHWNYVRTKATNLGAALLEALREIAKANQDKPCGEVGNARRSNRRRASDGQPKALNKRLSMLPPWALKAKPPTPAMPLSSRARQ